MLQYRTAAFLTRCERPSAEPPQADQGSIIVVRSLPERPFNEQLVRTPETQRLTGYEKTPRSQGFLSVPVRN